MLLKWSDIMSGHTNSCSDIWGDGMTCQVGVVFYFRWADQMANGLPNNPVRLTIYYGIQMLDCYNLFFN